MHAYVCMLMCAWMRVCMLNIYVLTYACIFMQVILGMNFVRVGPSLSGLYKARLCRYYCHAYMYDYMYITRELL